MNIIGIDPGLKCGWAYYWSEDRPRCGTWDLSGPKGKFVGETLVMLGEYTRDLLVRVQPEIVVAELGLRISKATEQHNKMRGVIQAECSLFGCRYVEVAPKSLKKHATGTGNATKDMMRVAFEKRFPKLGADLLDDNAIDAMFLADYGRTELVEKKAG